MSDIVLTEQETQFILNELAARDSIMRLLLQKQAEATRRQDAQETPMRVVGGAA